jgi:PEP-CTERM motif
MKSFRQIRRLSIAVSALALAGTSLATTINTNDNTVYNTFATGATLQNFESISGMTPLALDSYGNALNSSTAVPAAAQLGLDIPGLLFHSGGGSFNNPTGNPGTPTALLALGLIVDDAHSASNVVGSLEINTENLDLDQFIEIVFINTLQARVGVWLNPSLGNVTMTAFDSSGSSLEQVSGTAGNFVGFERSAADIKFVSIVNTAGGFTIDDLTYAGARTTTTVSEPGSLALLGLSVLGLAQARRSKRR